MITVIERNERQAASEFERVAVRAVHDVCFPHGPLAGSVAHGEPLLPPAFGGDALRVCDDNRRLCGSAGRRRQRRHADVGDVVQRAPRRDASGTDPAAGSDAGRLDAVADDEERLAEHGRAGAALAYVDDEEVGPSETGAQADDVGRVQGERDDDVA